MGADLYISTVYDRDEDAGYYRDSYNATNILRKLGLSWWKLYEEYKLGDNDSTMMPEQAKDFLGMVETRKPVLDKFLEEELSIEWLEANHCVADDLNGWMELWTNKYDELVRFLNLSISEDSPIVWSV